MGFLDSLKLIISGGAAVADHAYWVYVRCRRCGEAIKTRIDLHNDLSIADEGGYVVNKTLMGSNLCFERVKVTLRFDGQRRLADRQVSQGEFISAEEYATAQNLNPPAT